MMQMIEDGNLDYQAELHSLARSGKPGTLTLNGSFRQLQYLLLCSTILTSRAAIRGGLSPETSLTLCDHYFQEIDNTSTYEELRQISDRMLDDYIHRVHDCKTTPGISAPIRQCCEYIRFHYQEKFNAERLAEQIGYSSSYLSKKFRREIGMSLSDYVAKIKVDKAVEMLRTPGITIAEVSDFLGYTSQSYFGMQFKKFYGITPGEYQRLGFLPNGNA